MTREGLKAFSTHILIPFMMGASIGLLFMYAIYLLDVGGLRSLLVKTGGSLFDVGLIPVAFAFGALSIGTKELLIDN
ncbi:hypothetical protein [Bradyrhizobium diversitatis]|uniref:Uncharacterized protein n=1 Tax=Bradyrhizobium diversitatis TaxID=2755406 RepID=A0ABS0P5W2_9BRAD|nr:hypothetical protein [Bradyrhizobium diversitatis]MBH5388584.1 hypothetical protein [Bradyrhizobium diversitatis]